MFADLHTHSIYSDGWYAPDELCARAKRNGLSLLSITDHDTLAGEEIKRACAKKAGLAYLTGWEISAYLGDQKMHVLGYGCRVDGAYFRFMEERKRAAIVRAEECIEKLAAVGVFLTMDEVFAERSSPDLPVHTMHVARVIGRKTGLSETAAYAEYLAYGKAAHPFQNRPTPKESIECIHESGGLAFLAHPGRIFMGKEDKERTILQLVDEGLDGIECHYTTHTEEETAYFSRLARENKLLVSGGSDTHFEEETHVIGLPKFTPSGEFLERLKIKL